MIVSIYTSAHPIWRTVIRKVSIIASVVEIQRVYVFIYYMYFIRSYLIVELWIDVAVIITVSSSAGAVI